MSQAPQPQERLVDFIDVERAPLHIVLVEPEIPPNTGNVARLCAATGCALHLVEPLGFRIDDRELKRAGLDYWDRLNVVTHASLDAFLEVTRDKRRWFFSTRAKTLLTQAPFAFGDMLVFGPETRGLPQHVIDAHLSSALRIPMRPHSVRSINLSTAAGVCAYTALAAIGLPGLE